MKSEVPWFGELWFAITDYKSSALDQEILTPWLPKAVALMKNLLPFQQVSGPDDDQERLYGLWDLYALSRISDQLLLGFQSTTLKAWDGPSVTRQQYVRFFEELGFASFDAKPGEFFSPYHHEIFQVEQSTDGSEPITIHSTEWPGLCFGNMLFSRAGVRIRGGAQFVVKDVAETSTLYFSYSRLRRSTEDLSMGWGHNSQWRTRFRRDYEHPGRLYYNVDGKDSLFSSPATDRDRDELTSDERIELCKNRCFIRTTKPSEDLWPYDYSYTEDF